MSDTQALLERIEELEAKLERCVVFTHDPKDGCHLCGPKGSHPLNERLAFWANQTHCHACGRKTSNKTWTCYQLYPCRYNKTENVGNPSECRKCGFRIRGRSKKKEDKPSGCGR